MAVSPWIVAADADALLAFLARVFEAREVGRSPGPDGRVGHAETIVAGSTVVVMDAQEGWSPTPSLLRLAVADLDAVLARALDAGARLVTARTSLPFGDDVARFSDPWGNLWWVHEKVEDVGVDDLLARMTHPATQPLMAAYEGSLDAEMRRRA